MTDRNDQSEAFVQRVAESIDRQGLIAPRAGVVVGVSGGLDSVCLLEVLVKLAAEPARGYRLTVAHLNHGLRRSADDDATFVADLASRYKLPCDVQRRDVAELARQTHQSIETAGRNARYELLEDLALAIGAECVAVAHHADDNIETILYRLLRGTHLRGLAGMPADRPMAAAPVRLVRPLLEVRREEIVAYAEQSHLSWRDDPTNTDTAFRRNFIRHELLPLLRDRLNPRVDDALIRLAGSAEQAEDHLSGLGRRLAEAARLPDSRSDTAELDLARLQDAPAVALTYAMRSALETLGASMGAIAAEHYHDLVRLVDADGPAAVSLPGDLQARRLADRIVIGPAGGSAPTQPSAPVVLPCPGITLLPGGGEIALSVEPVDTDALADHLRRRSSGSRSPGTELIDADAIEGPLLCRTRRDGDAFRPLGAPGRQSVSDFLTNAKCPPPQRAAIQCICDDVGIVYLAPLRIDDRVKVTDRTRRVIRLTCRLLGPEA